MRPLRRRLQIVFQDPHASLNPAMTIGAAIGDPLRFHGIAEGKADRERRVAEALERVGLAPASQFSDKYPTDLSGGQKQRAVLARAIILGPDILVADEPVSMLDMSVRAKILELMIELKTELDLTYVYITHDLATAKFFCDRIAIMYLGRIVELGPAEQIYADPKHPYTQSLLRAIPEPDPRRSRAARPAAGRDPRRGRAAPRLSLPPPVPEGLRGLRLGEPRPAQRARDPVDEAAGGRVRGRARVDRRPRRARPGVVRDGAPLIRRVTPARTPSRSSTRCSKDAPEDPLWKGVAETKVVDRGVEVSFHEGLEPRRLDIDGVEVECHLHDPEAIAPRAGARLEGRACRPS